MATDIKIYGELNAMTEEGIAVRSQQTYDSEQQKFQSVINKEQKQQTGFFVCETAGATASKTVTASGYALVNGGAFKILMANKNSVANATLNINGTGAKPLYYAGARASASNTWEDNETVEVYYDGTNYYANNVVGRDKNAYHKPNGGIPKTDLESSVQTSLTKADEAYKKPQGGIPKSDLSDSLQGSINKADSAYQKPQGGVPKSDMASDVQTSLGKADTAYQKPSGGIPQTDLTQALSNKIDSFVTKSVNDLTNYYLKSETYTKNEVTTLINAIQQFTYEVVAELPSASASTMHKIYLVPSTNSKTKNVKDEYITILDNSVYKWEQIGSTTVDLSAYSTTEQMNAAINTALSAYTTTANLTTLLSQKQDTIDASHKLNADLVDDSTSAHKFVSSSEKSTWNGKQNAIDASHKLDADLVDDTNSTHKFTNATEKATWNGKQDSINDLSDIRSGAGKGATAYQKPSGGIPQTDLDSTLNTKINSFITNTVNNLANYYLKTETYTKIEVNDLVNAISQFRYEVAATLPMASASTMRIIYLIPSTNPQTQNVKDEFITIATTSGDTTTYSWEQIGSTTVDLSGYSTTTQMNAAITSALNTALADYFDKEDIVEILELYARKDGFYESMGVGVAKRLEGKTDAVGSFFERPTGGNAELANGLAQLNEVQGGSVKFNQLVQNGNFASTDVWKHSDQTLSVENNIAILRATTDTLTRFMLSFNFNIIEGHKYYFQSNVKLESSQTFPDNAGFYYGYVASPTQWFDTDGISEILGKWKCNKEIVTANADKSSIAWCIYRSSNNYSFNTNDTAYFKNCMFIDLTAIFGAGNEPSTVAEFEAWLAANVGLQEYYDYNAGSVINNSMTGIESIGFNLFNPTTGKARIIGAYSDVYGNYYGIVGTHGTLTFEDDLGNVSTITPDAYGKFELDVSGYLSVADAGNDVAVFLWWDGNKTEYEDYDVEIAHLDVRHIYGKKNGTGELVQVWPTGMPKVGDVIDKLCIENGAVVAKRLIQEVNLGSLEWAAVRTSNVELYGYRMQNRTTPAKAANINSAIANILCCKYKAVAAGSSGTYGGNVGVSVDVESRVYVYDTNYNGTDSAATFKTAMSGVLLYYELATPETYTDLVYMGSEYFADGTPVTLPVNYKVDNWGIETILPKNTSTILTAKPTIKVRYAIDAVEQLNTHEAFIEAMPDNYVKRSTLAQTTGNSTTNAMSQDAVTKLLEELYRSLSVAEGYVRVAGSSSPALSFKHYESSEFGQKSAYSLFFPCLVGTKLSGGDEQVGKILHVLKKLGARVATSEDTGFTEGQAVWEDLEGTLHAIDGSEGDVMICNTAPYYRIMGRYTINGTEYDVFLMSSKPFTWQGIVAEEVGKFGWAPDYCVSHLDSDSVQRMHSVYNPSWGGSYQAPDSCVGKFVYSVDAETGDIVETYDATATLLGGAGGLHSTNITLYDGEQHAMNNNVDTTKTVPWMNATAAGAENMFALMLSEGGTFDAHNATLMGSGFCGNDGATAEADWAESASGAKNGMRLKDKNDAWKYYNVASNVKTILGKDANFYAGQMINTYRNPWHIMEAHRAVCYAVENGVQELEWFVFEGNKYKYRSVTGFRGPSQGEMTCVVFKLMATKAAANVVDPTDTTTSIEGNRIEFLVSTALFHGMTTQVSPSWWTSGLIFTEDENQDYECYMERDQSKLIKSVSGDKLTSESWDFETVYKHVGSFAKGEGYRKNYSNDALMLPDTNANKTGAGLHTYVGAYNWFTGTAAPTGKKSVRGFRRGSLVYYPFLSPLALIANISPAGSASYFAFGTCVRIVD